VRRCVMNGIDLGGSYLPWCGVSDCVVDSVGGAGIKIGRALREIARNRVRHTGSHGIVVDEAYPGASDNVVVDAGGDGIRLGWVIDPSMVERNVVGRCMGAGLVAPGGRRNTSYLNGGEGFVFFGGDLPDTVALNVAYRNGGPGLRWSGPAIPYLACNDWFENAGGATVGVDASPSDRDVDPMFCDVLGDHVGLMEGSALADAAGCGLIGAVGVECRANRAPDVSAATATVKELWPPDRRFVRVGIRGIRDPDGD